MFIIRFSLLDLPPLLSAGIPVRQGSL